MVDNYGAVVILLSYGKIQGYSLMFIKNPRREIIAVS